MQFRIPEPELMDLADEAKAYAAADFSAVNERFVDRLLELIDATDDSLDPANVVDLGCGPADIPIRLLLRRPMWRVTAVDGAEAMLTIARSDIAKAALAASISLVHADALATGLPGNSFVVPPSGGPSLEELPKGGTTNLAFGGRFDVVISNSILHHVRSAIALWEEIKRLCRPGGLVFVRDLCRPTSEADAEKIVQTYAGGESKLLQQEFHRSLLAAYTVDEVAAQLAQAGLTTLRVAKPTDRHLDVYGCIGEEPRFR